MRALTLVHRFIPVIGPILILYSCSTGRTTQPSTGSKPVAEIPKSSAQDGWLPKLTTVAKQYSIQDSSTISTDSDSTHISPIQTTTIYSITLRSLADSIALTATIDSVSTSSHLQGIKAHRDTVFPRKFYAMISSTGQISPILGHPVSMCVGGIDLVTTRILDLIPSYPQKYLKVGDKWTETVSTTICRGKTLLLQNTFFEYELINLTNQHEHEGAEIQRTGSTTFTGVSNDSKNHLTVNGSGYSLVTLYVDRITGVLLASNGHSQASLTISTSRGFYPFLQTVTTHIEGR